MAYSVPSCSCYILQSYAGEILPFSYVVRASLLGVSVANEAINAFVVECPVQMHDLVHGHDGSTAIRRPVALVEKYARYKRVTYWIQ